MPRYIKIVLYRVGFLLLQFRGITIFSFTNKSIDRRLQERAAQLLRHFWLHTIRSMAGEGSVTVWKLWSVYWCEQCGNHLKDACPVCSLWVLSLSSFTVGWRIINLPSQLWKRNCFVKSKFDNEESQVSRSNKVGA